MNVKHTLFLPSLLTLSISIPVNAGTFTAFDARSAAMGGTGVASAQISSAPAYNPAMLAAQHAEEDFSILVGAGISVQDDDDLFVHLSNFSEAINADVPDVATADSESDLASAAKPASLQVNAYSLLGWSGTTWSMAIASTSSVQADISFNKDGANGVSSTLDLAGAELEETGLSFARKFGKYSVGLTPKTVDVSSYYSSTGLASSNGDMDSITDSLKASEKDHGSMMNLDIGVVYHVYENLKVGAVHQNLVSKTYTRGPKTFSLTPTTRIGAAYTGDIITFAADYDLVKKKPLIDGGDYTQFMAAGVELDLLDTLQLRAGYNKNMAVASSTPTISAGVGINILTLQLDVTAMQNNSATSVFLQLGLRW